MFESSPRMYVMFFKKEMSTEYWVTTSLTLIFQTKQRGHSTENIYEEPYLKEISLKFPSKSENRGFRSLDVTRLWE